MSEPSLVFFPTIVSYGNTIGGYAHALGRIMERIAQFWDAVPQGAQWAFAGLGALLVAKKALGFLQMVLNIFILSGTNVSQSHLPFPPLPSSY